MGTRSAPSITPLEADLAGSSSSTRPTSSGRRRCEKQKAEGVKRTLVGFEMTRPGIGRDGYEVLH